MEETTILCQRKIALTWNHIQNNLEVLFIRIFLAQSVDDSVMQKAQQKKAMFDFCDYRKTPKNSDSRKIAVLILKFEQCGSTIVSYVQKMQTELQTE